MGERWLDMGPRGSVELVSGAMSGGGRLSDTERRLLCRLAEEAGVDVPRERLLEDVFGYSPTSRSRTLDTTIRRLRSKVDTEPPTRLLTVVGVGYRLEVDGGGSVAAVWTRLHELSGSGCPVSVVGPPGSDGLALLERLGAPHWVAAQGDWPGGPRALVDARGRVDPTELAARLGQRPAGATVFVVSWRPLRMPDEQVVRLGPMAPGALRRRCRDQGLPAAAPGLLPPVVLAVQAAAATFAQTADLELSVRAGRSRVLEALTQALSVDETARRIDELAGQLARDMPPGFWDDQ